MYATVHDLRAEGITSTQADDARLLSLLIEASTTIDHLTGWFFEPRALTLRLDGRGTASLEPPVPPIHIQTLYFSRESIAVPDEWIGFDGAPVHAGFMGPVIYLFKGRRFPRGHRNIIIKGTWGYTEPDGTPEGRTPLDIRRACMMMVLRWLPPLGHEDSTDVRNRWRVIEERTRDQAYKLGPQTEPGVLTGDPDIDRILVRYGRPQGLGAV